MIHFKKIMLSTVALAGFGLQPALAENFTSHHLVEEKPYEIYAENLSADQKLELKRYLNYVEREPCQNYRPAPDGFTKEGCDLMPEAYQRQLVQINIPAEPVTKMHVRNVLTDYELQFAFDSALIEPAAGHTLDQVAHEIDRYKPSEVTIAGYTDKAGPSDYNADLSKRRAEAVSHALNDRGISNRILDEEAYGENYPAVNTKDGVALRENRRVVVEFRK